MQTRYLAIFRDESGWHIAGRTVAKNPVSAHTALLYLAHTPADSDGHLEPEQYAALGKWTEQNRQIRTAEAFCRECLADGDAEAIREALGDLRASFDLAGQAAVLLPANSTEAQARDRMGVLLTRCLARLGQSVEGLERYWPAALAEENPCAPLTRAIRFLRVAQNCVDMGRPGLGASVNVSMACEILDAWEHDAPTVHLLRAEAARIQDDLDYLCQARDAARTGEREEQPA